MGLWNAVGRWLVWAVGLLLVILGGVAVWNGLDIVQMERGWTAVIAGTIALTAGILTILLGVLIDRVEALRSALLTTRALQIVEAAEFSAPLPIPVPAFEADPEPPKPIEVPVEPFPSSSASPSGSTFSFRSFGKRSASERPPEGSPEAIEPELTTTEAEAAPDLPPEQIRRFAPPQFRMSSVTPPAVAIDPVPQPPEPEPAPEPEPPVEVSVEPPADVTHAEELHLPRAAALPPLRAEEPAAAIEPPPQRAPDVVASAEAASAGVEALPSAAEEIPATGSQRAIAQTHEWLEKALAGEEAEPGLDWLRQRRSGEDRSGRKFPSFMRRHSEPEPAADADVEADAVAGATPATDPQVPDTDAAVPGVVGRYTANGSEYTLYANGTIDAQTPLGPRHFSNMGELRIFLEKQNEQAES